MPGAMAWAKAFEQNWTTTIDLARNETGAESATVLAKALEVSQSGTTIN